MSARSVSSSRLMVPCSVMWRYQESPSRTVIETRGFCRRYSRRLRPSSMFTTTWPSSQRYQVATVFGAPSGVTEPMIAGLGFSSTRWSSSGSGGLGMVGGPTRCARRDRARCREVDLDGVGDVRRVAAGERDADRRADARRRVEHERVAGAQAGLRQREAAEPVALPRVGAGEEEHEIGMGDRDGAVERVLERLQVLRVSRAGAQVDVEVGGRAVERVVRPAVQGQREAARVAREQLGRAVALVDVAIDDEDSAEPGLCAQGGDRDGDVVEKAVAATLCPRGVMRSAAEVHPEAALERVAGGVDRAERRAPAALDELRGPRQAERALLARRELAALDAVEVRRVVDGAEQRPRRGIRAAHLAEALALDRLAQQAVLRQREAVPLRQGEAMAIVRPEPHPRSMDGGP